MIVHTNFVCPERTFPCLRENHRLARATFPSKYTWKYLKKHACVPTELRSLNVYNLNVGDPI